MFTDTTLVAFVSMGSTGVVSVYDAELVVAGDNVLVVAVADIPVVGDNVPAVVEEDASVVREDAAPVVGERVEVAPAVEFGKAGQTKWPPFSASK